MNNPPTVYRLQFIPSADKEWRKLDNEIRHQFTKKLKERLQYPRVPSARLADLPNCYKIKLRKSGYRLVYQVLDEIVLVQVIAVGKRERNIVYDEAKRRL